MKVVALLSWYDEPPDWLYECVTCVARLADHVVAVDGPYIQFPGAAVTPASPPDQVDAIRDAAADAGVPVKLHRPGHPWPSEVAKRDHMFRLAEPFEPDWLFRIDADEFVGDVPGDARDRLAGTRRHVAEATLWHQGETYETPLRVLFRALPEITISHAHNLVTCVVDGKRLVLAGDSSTYHLEPAEQLDMRIEHRRALRPVERQRAKKTYYKIMPQIETVMPRVEKGSHLMKIRMKVHIVGARNGVRWPARGGVLDLPDREAAKLCAAGLAEPVVEDRVETAVAPPAEERHDTGESPKRKPGRPRRSE